MKLAITALLIGSAAAFAPAPIVHPRTLSSSPTALFDTTAVDSSDAIKEALAASEKYGATSKEARIAWEIVEEMDSSNSHVSADSDAAVKAKAEKEAEEAAAAKREANKPSKVDSPEYAAAVAEAKALTEQVNMLSGRARVGKRRFQCAIYYIDI